MAEEKRVNLKAKKFEAYIQKNNMNFFNKNEVHDEADTVVFQSNIKVEGQTIPMGIITDNMKYLGQKNTNSSGGIIFCC